MAEKPEGLKSLASLTSKEAGKNASGTESGEQRVSESISKAKATLKTVDQQMKGRGVVSDDIITVPRTTLLKWDDTAKKRKHELASERRKNKQQAQTILKLQRELAGKKADQVPTLAKPRNGEHVEITAQQKTKLKKSPIQDKDGEACVMSMSLGLQESPTHKDKQDLGKEAHKDAHKDPQKEAITQDEDPKQKGISKQNGIPKQKIPFADYSEFEKFLRTKPVYILDSEAAETIKKEAEAKKAQQEALLRVAEEARIQKEMEQIQIKAKADADALIEVQRLAAEADANARIRAAAIKAEREAEERVRIESAREEGEIARVAQQNAARLERQRQLEMQRQLDEKRIAEEQQRAAEAQRADAERARTSQQTSKSQSAARSTFHSWE